MANNLTEEKSKIFDYVDAMLGGGMVDVELDPRHYEIALSKALTRFRQRSDHSVEESYSFLTLIEDQNTYTLPNEVIEVRKIYRRSIGSRSSGSNGGSSFDPFNLAYTNTYLMSSSSIGGLLTYELFSGYQELVGRMFGSFIEFKFNSSSKQLTILQRPRSDIEEVLLYTYNYKPDIVIMTDTYSGQWIKDYTVAACKMMLGEARSKFATIAGPQGGSTLNGDALKNEAQAEMEKLEEEVKMNIAGGTGYGFIIG